MSQAVLPYARLDFLSAKRLVKAFSGPALPFRLAASGTLDPLLLFIQAHLARAGWAAQASTLPFGTLGHALHSAAPDEAELFLLLPWDFVPELDWRTGIPPHTLALDTALAQAAAVAQRLAARTRATIVYLDAPLPSVLADAAQTRRLARQLAAHVFSLDGAVLDASHFSLTSYLDSGCPIASSSFDVVGHACADAALRFAPPPAANAAKVLVTDLDNVVWQGVIAEDGLDGVAFGPEGRGWRAFLYQGLLKRLKNEGTLLVAVSRNRPEDVLPAFQSGRMILREDDLVAIVASYEAKSAQIRSVAASLNLGLDAFVFVDDNPIELAETAAALPQLTQLRFPDTEAELPAFLATLAGHFTRHDVTAEDRRRTELYRQRLASLPPSAAAGGDVRDFLRGLAMRLVLREPAAGVRSRAVQLINKTNQFNLNGTRLDEATVASRLDAGWRLFTGELIDRTGSHGEVLALLVSPEGMVASFVMSCRVFLRRAEYAFLIALTAHGVPLRRFAFQTTEKNLPFRQFLSESALSADADGFVAFDAAAFTTRHADEHALFTLAWSQD